MVVMVGSCDSLMTVMVVRYELLVVLMVVSARSSVFMVVGR